MKDTFMAFEKYIKKDPKDKIKPPGRPLGAKNLEDYNSLRKLLEIGFKDNRLAIIQRLNRMLDEHASMEDFKWAMNLKASIEPKQLKIDTPQNNQIVLIRSDIQYKLEAEDATITGTTDTKV